MVPDQTFACQDNVGHNQSGKEKPQRFRVEGAGLRLCPVRTQNIDNQSLVLLRFHQTT